MMPPFPVLCTTPQCGRPALYKIAARWSDGVTEELKTYALCCADCLPTWYTRGRHQQAHCRRAQGRSWRRLASTSWPGASAIERW